MNAPRPGSEASRRPPGPPAVAPSILSADFSRLGEDLRRVDPARDWVHCDVMDNAFVPNLTFGPLIVGAVSKLTSAWRDVHLMIERPESLIEAFRRAGADSIIVHLEACRDPGAVLDQVRACGARVGLALRPRTPLASAEPWLTRIDHLLVMTVEPGFGGQPFMEDMLPKVAAARAWRERHGAGYCIEVDGGIDPHTARRCREAGAEVFVAGQAIYAQADPGAALEALRSAAGVS